MSRITTVEIFDTRPRLSSVFQFGNTRRHESSNIFVKVLTDSGDEGWGEACPVPQLTTATSEEIVSDIGHIAHARLIGQSSEQIPNILDSLRGWTSVPIFARTALDTALLDLRARLLGVRLADLLGGVKRDLLQVHGSVGWDQDGEKMADVAEHQAAEYGVLKTYLGRSNPAEDLGRLKTMRSRVPDSVEFLVDINKLWSDATFADAAPALRELGVVAVEQPTPEPSHGVVAAGEANELMIVWDESIRSPKDVVSWDYMGPQGTINVGISKLGGPSEARAVTAVAEALGLPVAVGSLVEMGIGSVAGAHIAATVSSLPLPSYVMGFLKYEMQVTIPELSITDGALALPAGPGLGVVVNEEAIEAITAAKEIIG